MSELDLDAIEARHPTHTVHRVNHHGYYDVQRCNLDSQDAPCDAVALVQELRQERARRERAEAALNEASAFVDDLVADAKDAAFAEECLPTKVQQCAATLEESRAKMKALLAVPSHEDALAQAAEGDGEVGG